MAVVTVSRSYGAGGLRIGPTLADRIGFRFVDREIMEEAARRIGVDPAVARSLDERAPALIEEVGLALASGTPEMGAVPRPAPGDRTFVEATRRVIESLADVGGYVVLGRGAQAALAGRRDACHLSVVANLDDRVRRIMESQRVDEREAAARCERVDAERAGYVRRFYNRDIGEPLLYDAVVNTSKLGVEGAIEVCLAVVRRRLGL